MKYRHFTLFVVLFFLASALQAQIPALKQKIAQITKSKNAEVGVAVLELSNWDSLMINADRHYPMQSVFKFHLAIAVLHQVDKGKLSLDQKIFVKKSDLLPNTWSPLAVDYPKGDVEIPLSSLLKYTVSQSDNNGCDILFRLLGGPKKVSQYMNRLGIKSIAIVANEEEMHKSWDVQFLNWTTPRASTQLLEKFFQTDILSKTSRDFLWQAMVETSTGLNRLKGLLPEGAIVGHKTGSSGANEKGITAAANDIGVMVLPNGKKIAIAVYVSNSKESEETNAGIIAAISKAVWDYFSEK